MAINDFAIIGLSNIGRGFALNMQGRKYSVGIYDDDYDTASSFSADCVSRVKAYRDIKALIASVSVPRKIFLCAQADKIDGYISAMLPFLGKSDIIIDFSESLIADVKKRAEDLTLKNIRYLDAAATGPHTELSTGTGIVVGGDDEAYNSCSRILRQLSREYKGFSSCIHSGLSGTARFTKIVHDGIEAALLQVVADGYYMLRTLGEMKIEEISAALAFINEELNLYVLKTAVDILEQIDEESGDPIMDFVMDTANVARNEEHCIKESFLLQVPSLNAGQAVLLKYLSAQRDQRRISASKLYAPDVRYEMGSIRLLDSLKDAMKATMIITYAQGFDLLSAKIDDDEWNYGEDEIARVWSAASTIRSSYVARAQIAFNKNDNLLNLMHDEYFSNQLKSVQKGFREIVMLSAKHSVPVPSIMSALSYYDSMRCAVLPANLIQSQLNYMRRDTVRRYDIQGNFNVDWVVEDKKK